MSASITVTQEPFGSMLNPKTGTEQSVAKFIVKNSSGAQLHLISYGAAVTSIVVPDKSGKLDDVVLGFDDLDGIFSILLLKCLYYNFIIYKIRLSWSEGEKSLFRWTCWSSS